ncbi:MAG: metallophosphoesterase [bacterium]|nr:metallophosphoesterase [bacterium]
MLLIGDIHISSRLQEKVIKQLRSFVEEHDDQEHIVFVGDYVYHFSYDRNALFALYEFFVELFNKGKKVYILAGNHDWLGQHFVFAEAQKAFELLQKQGQNQGQILFITKPLLTTIE